MFLIFCCMSQYLLEGIQERCCHQEPRLYSHLEANRVSEDVACVGRRYRRESGRRRRRRRRWRTLVAADSPGERLMILGATRYCGGKIFCGPLRWGGLRLRIPASTKQLKPNYSIRWAARSSLRSVHFLLSWTNNDM